MLTRRLKQRREFRRRQLDMEDQAGSDRAAVWDVTEHLCTDITAKSAVGTGASGLQVFRSVKTVLVPEAMLTGKGKVRTCRPSGADATRQLDAPDYRCL